MATTQYIGARYVPIFYSDPETGLNNWRSGIAYDPLTIVTDLNQSYTSKIPVPATIGRPSENPNYWVLTGAYNAQVEQYRQEVTELSQTVEDIEEELTKYPAYVMIGDSYGHASGTNAGWIDKLAEKLGLTAGDTLFSSGVGGSGLLTTPTSFNTQLNDLYDTMTADQRASVGTVIIVGGSNDMGHTVAELEPAMATLVANAKTKFPNAVIWVGMGSGNYDAHFATAQKPRITAAYRRAANYGAKYLNNIEYALHDRALIGSDKVHPTNAGYVALTNAIYSALHDSFNYLYEAYGLFMTPAESSSSGLAYRLDLDNGIAKLQTTSIWDIQRTAVSLTYNQSAKIGSLADKTIIGDDNSYYNFNRTFTPVMTTITGSNSISKAVMCLIWIDDNADVWIRNVDVEVSGGTTAFSAVSRIIIPMFSITIPSIAC